MVSMSSTQSDNALSTANEARNTDRYCCSTCRQLFKDCQNRPVPTRAGKHGPIHLHFETGDSPFGTGRAAADQKCARSGPRKHGALCRLCPMPRPRLSATGLGLPLGCGLACCTEYGAMMIEREIWTPTRVGEAVPPAGRSAATGLLVFQIDLRRGVMPAEDGAAHPRELLMSVRAAQRLYFSDWPRDWTSVQDRAVRACSTVLAGFVDNGVERPRCNLSPIGLALIRYPCSCESLEIISLFPSDSRPRPRFRPCRTTVGSLPNRPSRTESYSCTTSKCSSLTLSPRRPKKARKFTSSVAMTRSLPQNLLSIQAAGGSTMRTESLNI